MTYDGVERGRPGTGRGFGGGPVHRRHHPHHQDGQGPGRGRGPGSRDERGGHRRAQRGDVRAAVLLLLVDQPMHGYQLMQAIADRTEGAWRPSPGAIYPTIAQLEDEGMVSVVADSGRKLVALTDAGRTYVSDQGAAMADPFSAVTRQAGGHRDLRGAVEQLHVAARAVAQTGSDSQLAAAQQVLESARRSLYLILADGDSGSSPTALDSSSARSTS